MIRVICRKLSRIFHFGWLYKFAYCESFYFSQDDLAVASIPVLHDTKINELKSLINFAEKHNLWMTIMFHSVVKKGEELYNDTWSYDYTNFCKLITYLKSEKNNGKLELMTSESAFNKIIQER